MRTIKVFIDTNIVNYILDIDKQDSKNLTYQEDVELLTADRKHLASIKLRDYISDKGLYAEIKIFTPKEFYNYLKNEGFAK